MNQAQKQLLMSFLTQHYYCFFRSFSPQQKNACLSYVELVGNILMRHNIPCHIAVSTGHACLFVLETNTFLDITSYTPLTTHKEGAYFLVPFSYLKTLQRYNKSCTLAKNRSYLSLLQFMQCALAIPHWKAALHNIGFKLIRLGKRKKLNQLIQYLHRMGYHTGSGYHKIQEKAQFVDSPYPQNKIDTLVYGTLLWFIRPLFMHILQHRGATFSQSDSE